MTDLDPDRLFASPVFRLGILGDRATRDYAARLADLGVTPKHVGVLGMVAAGRAGSQREIATALGVAPSLVVQLVDRLEELGALERRRSTDDRRVQRLELTPRGADLLTDCLDRLDEAEHDLANLLGHEDLARLAAALPDVSLERTAGDRPDGPR